MDSPLKKKDTRTSEDMYHDAPLFAEFGAPFVTKPKAATDKTPKTGKKKPPTTGKSPRKKAAKPGRSASQPRAPKPVNKEALLLSVADMCALLGVSRATLIRMDNGGKLPGRIKLGGSVKYHRETVETWLKEMIVKSDT
ncbi:AlpA family transcriptional regulator [Geobacter sp. SVR]|uniref:helix-turn-helix transcriptional regulator n=1 Tax=Geobacter sp. SVR TaxID=2495594 RepID=UPI00143EF73D|nr:helix-turn-helix domain-containing protein [Geobacter sp. SVR]BCS53866.1 hypothetical protein GSVR_21740 [Geobacter sp. SVR]GCF85625.1 hypothetical protein GSbR_22250 [Geobacter sp. SVR]